MDAQQVGLAGADVLPDVVDTAPVALPHGLAHIHCLGRVFQIHVVVVLVIPAGVADPANGMPGKPPVEHLAGGAGEEGLVGDEAGAVLQLPPAELAGQIAGLKQVVAILDAQGIGVIAGPLIDELVALWIAGGAVLEIVLVITALFVLVGGGYFFSLGAHSLMIFV